MEPGNQETICQRGVSRRFHAEKSKGGTNYFNTPTSKYDACPAS